MIQGSNELNEKLVKLINEAKRIHLTPTRVGQQFIIRFAICAKSTEEKDIEYAWNEICCEADNALKS